MELHRHLQEQFSNPIAKSDIRNYRRRLKLVKIEIMILEKL